MPAQENRLTLLRTHAPRELGWLLALCAVAATQACSGSPAVPGPTGAENTPQNAPPSPEATAPEASAAVRLAAPRERWRKAMTKVPVPRTGCFEATEPAAEWVEVPCGTVTTPHHPTAQALAAGAAASAHPTPTTKATGDLSLHPLGGTTGPATAGSDPQVGNGNDDSAQASTLISWAEGSFPSVSVTSENQSGAPDTFSLQLNTNRGLPTLLCSSSLNPACSGWEQFVYWQGSAELWYILVNYGTSACPDSSWNNTGGACYKQAANSSAVPHQSISNLANMTLTGMAGTSTDTVIVTTGDGKAYAASNPNALGLSGAWTSAEFNVFGNNTLQQATFVGNATIVAQTLTDSSLPVQCKPNSGTTGETNSLNLVSCCAIGGESPGIQLTESNVAGATAPPCPSAITRIGALAGGSFFVKEGGLSTAWVDELDNVRLGALSGNRIGVLTSGNSFWVKEGGLSATWFDELDNVQYGTLSGNRIGVLTNLGTFYVKEGGLSAAWVNEHDAVEQGILSGNRIGVLTQGGSFLVKEGSLSEFWTDERDGVKRGALELDRIGVLTEDGRFFVKEGSLSDAWVEELDGVAEIALSGNRIGALTTGGSFLVKEGGLSAAWVDEYDGVTQGVLSGDRIGVLTTGGSFLVKEGGLSAAWFDERDGVAQGALY